MFIFIGNIYGFICYKIEITEFKNNMVILIN